MDLWACKPSVPVVQHDHPLAQRRVFCWVPYLSKHIGFPELVTGVKGTPNGIALTNSVAGHYGVGLDGGTTNGNEIDFGNKALWDFANAYTISLWFRVTDPTTRALFNKANTHNVASGWILGTTTGSVLKIQHGNAGSTQINGATTLVAGSAYNAAVTWDKANSRVYLNGKLDGSGANTRVPASSGQTLALGAPGDGATAPGCWFFGAMLWNRALGPDEVRALYADPWGSVRPSGFMQTRGVFGMGGAVFAPPTPTATTDDRTYYKRVVIMQAA